ncbi:VLRF1 family aeRF1-type release factor [Halalkalibacter kiskunsagensis]|uniref:VLRF1 family aeRF1-type release factor n=1 Tax=Halalkalibacter kiskunsagensis TaxID=1548599 RepID=A0ABV6KA17_9BACI
MTFAKELEQLKEHDCKEGCLTIYLNTDQTSNDQQKGEWKIRLKNGLKKLEEYIHSSEHQNLAAYKKVKKQVQEEFNNLQLELPKSVVLIASATGKVLIKKLQISLENEFHWEKQPVLNQLERIQGQFPTEGIIFIQKEDIFTIETSLGEVKKELAYHLNFEDEDWKQYEGVAARERMASGANHRDKYQNRLEANQQRWYKTLAGTIEKEAKIRGWTAIYLVGQPDATSEFEKYLDYIKVKKINKNYHKFTSKELVGQVLAS